MPALSKPPPAADSLDQRLIALRHAGTPWPECARRLLHSVAALRMRANRLRDAGEWKTPDGKPARGAPKPGGRGRPRLVVPNVPASIRLAPDAANALRTVAACASLRLGEVVAEAMQRAVDRAANKRVSRPPLGLDPGEPFDLCDGNKSETLSVNVPKPLYEAFIATTPGKQPTSAIADAVHRLLRDLNYRLVECE